MKVEQLLHGYNNGHHLIAGSVSLSIDDADRVSYLSDWSGYINNLGEETSYITAYPLEKNHLYVVAKSWYAEEMSRPGCVWTHSLIVDLDDFRRDDDICDVVNLFRRPKVEGEDFSYYTKTLELKTNLVNNKRKPLTGMDPTRLLFLTARLLENNKPLIYTIENKMWFYEELCLRLIQSIPLGFLKGISICSGSTNIRRIGESFFNLQFIVGKGESLMTPVSDNSRPEADNGFQFWIDSIVDGRRDVAQMIHLFSVDIGNSSQRFLAVTNLLKLLNDKMLKNDRGSSLDDILIHLTTAFKRRDEGTTLKRSFLSEPIVKLFCDTRLFIVTLATTKISESLDYEEIAFFERVEEYRKEHPIKEYASLLVELCNADYLNEEGKKLLANSLDGLNNNEILFLLDYDWALFKSILTLNNQILVGDFWLDLQSTQFASLFAIFQRNVPDRFYAWKKLYQRLLTSDSYVSDSLLSDFVIHVDQYVQIALEVWNASKKTSMNKDILKLCMMQQKSVISWMRIQNSINNDIRKAIKKYISPDDTMVVDMGSNAWKVFVDAELQNESNANELVYVYVLAFNWRDYNALEYLKRVLPFIYDALSLETFSYSSWDRIERFTGSVPFWRSWDNCRKLLLGVRDYCKSMNLQDSDILKFTTNHKLNNELMELWKKR